MSDFDTATMMVRAYFVHAHSVQPLDRVHALEMERQTGIAGRVWLMLSAAHFIGALQTAYQLRVDILE
jgi:hypothetical protein